MMHRKVKLLILTLGFISLSAHCFGEATTYPRGLMLNLDFQNAANGLIPNKAFYPLHVPMGTLNTAPLLGKNMLVFLPGEGLDIPHSSLIQPDGSEWIVTLQLAAYPGGENGMVLSQCNAEFGYAIYLINGAPHAVIRTGNCSMLLKEERGTLLTDCRKQLAHVELRIKSDMAILTINRKRVAFAPLDAPLQGEDMPIRLGQHSQLPAILGNIPGAQASGFSGAVSSLKILRQ